MQPTIAFLSVRTLSTAASRVSMSAHALQLSSMQGQVERRERDLNSAIQEVNVRLEHVAGMTPGAAKKELLDNLRDEVTHESAAIIREAEQRTKAEADKKSRKILSLAIQRVAADHTARNYGENHSHSIRRPEGPHHWSRGPQYSQLRAAYGRESAHRRYS